MGYTRDMETEKPCLKLQAFCDMNQLYRLLDNWSKSCGMATVIVDTEGNQVSEDFGITEFCRMVQSCDKGKACCMETWKSDLDGVYECPFGFWDFSIPIVLPNGQVLGKVLAGQALSETQKDADILQKTAELGIDEDTVREVLSRVHRKTEREMQGAYALLKETLHFFIEKSYSIWKTSNELKTEPAKKDRILSQITQIMYSFACIIDWKMPDMDGIATTRAIRKAVGKDVPIIIISAYDWSDIEQEARAAGANAFISKPLFRSRLVKTFSALVGTDDSDEQKTPFAQLDTIDLKGSRALLVEDNALNAEIATEVLEMTGLTVEHAADGVEAVDKITACEDGYYDIIFMDIQMPRMNGYDAARAIRAMDRNYCKQVPIVAMTANAFAEDVHAAKTVGMNEHIAKPLDLNTLAKILKKWI